MAHMIPAHRLATRLAQSDRHDSIAVHNLDVTVNAGTDVWGRKKQQRALVSVVVTLDHGFASASATDTVDQSTVHYGTLSKAIQARLQADSKEWTATASLSASIVQSVKQVAGSTPLHAIQTDVCYVKGSMFGEGVGHALSVMEHEPTRSSTLYLRGIRVPCLIGVNSNERLRKQPIVVSLWADCVSDARIDDYAELEEVIVTVSMMHGKSHHAQAAAYVSQIVSETTYQTIESLLEHMVDQLGQKFFTHDDDKDVWIRLRVAKPLAVPFAEAPAVEIMRPLHAR